MADTRRMCLALDLKDDAEAIAAYEKWHRPGQCPPEIVRSLVDAGIANMEIYRAGNRLFMIMEVTDDYSDENKAAADRSNPAVQDWIALMAQFQVPIPAAGPNGTWMVMDQIYSLPEHCSHWGISR